MSLKKKIAFLMAVLMLLLAAGCGGTGGSADGSKETAAPPTGPGEKTSIVFADVGWDSILFNNAVAGLVAEEVFGYACSEITGSTPITLEALKNGEVDILMEMWTDNVAGYDEDIASGRYKELGLNFGDNMQGFYVPRYVIEGDAERGIEASAPGLKTVEDLANYPDIFRDDEDAGKGRIYGAIPGWDINNIMRSKYLHYGLDQTFNYFEPGSDAALSAVMMAAYDKGEPIVAYYWEPTWLLGKYDFVLLDDAPYDEDLYEDGACACPSVPVTICVSNNFYTSNPNFCAFLSNYRTTSAQISEALAYMQENKTNYEETAQWFLSEHPELLDQWLTAEQAETMRAALS